MISQKLIQTLRCLWMRGNEKWHGDEMIFLLLDNPRLEGGIESSIVSSHEIIFIWSSLLQSFHDSFSQYILVSRFDIKNIHPKDYLNVFILIFSLWWLKIPLKSWSMGSSLLQVDMITIHSSGYHRLNSSLQKVKMEICVTLRVLKLREITEKFIYLYWKL